MTPDKGIAEAVERGRPVPITPSGQQPPLHDRAPELHQPIGNTASGGPDQSVTLWQWLTLGNRRPDHRARQAALALIERLLAALNATDTAKDERIAVLERALTRIVAFDDSEWMADEVWDEIMEIARAALGSKKG